MPPVVGGEHRAGIACPHCAATMNVSTIEKIQPPVVMRFAGASVALTPIGSAAGGAARRGQRDPGWLLVTRMAVRLGARRVWGRLMEESAQRGGGAARVERRDRRRVGLRRLVVLVVGVVAVVAIVLGIGTDPPSTAGRGASVAGAGSGPGYLAAGSPGGLPGNILVADRNNDRLIILSPQGQTVSTKQIAGPSDAYFSPNGKSIFVTQHGAFDVARLGVVSGSVSYRYGHSGRPGPGDGYLHDPQTAQQLPDGRLLIADKSNCRILFVLPPAHTASTVLGRPRSCAHDPPRFFSFPDAAFPTRGGGLVVSELVPAWVDLLNRDGTLRAALRVPGLSAPYDANQSSGGMLIATSHARPGAIEEFTTAGRVLWRYAPASGPAALGLPSLAVVVPGGDVLVCDSGNDRVVVIDPRRNTIVWQYGHTGRAGSGPGYLHTPDSAILVP